jgi:translation elongation factor EF-G
LKKFSGEIELRISDPVSSYRETASKKGAVVMAASSNRLNRLWAQIEPLDENTIELLVKRPSSTADKQVADAIGGNIIAIEEHANVLVDLIGVENRSDEVLQAIISGLDGLAEMVQSVDNR